MFSSRKLQVSSAPITSSLHFSRMEQTGIMSAAGKFVSERCVSGGSSDACDEATVMLGVAPGFTLNRLCPSSDPPTAFIDLLFLFLSRVVTRQSLCRDIRHRVLCVSFLLRTGSHSVEGLRVIGLKIPRCSNYMELCGQSPRPSLSCTLDTSDRITRNMWT